MINIPSHRIRHRWPRPGRDRVIWLLLLAFYAEEIYPLVMIIRPDWRES